MRIHVSPDPIVALRDRSSELTTAAKPAGLWWANDADWLDWCMVEMPHKVHPNVVSLEFAADTNLAVLETAREIMDFTEAYGAQRLGSAWHQAYAIDWEAVARDYDGVDLRELVVWEEPGPGGGRSGYMPRWIHGLQRWDRASGCVWRPGPLTRVAPVAPEVSRGWLEALEYTPSEMPEWLRPTVTATAPAPTPSRPIRRR